MDSKTEQKKIIYIHLTRAEIVEKEIRCEESLANVFVLIKWLITASHKNKQNIQIVG